MFFQLLVAARLLAAVIGASQQDVVCWENVGPDVAGARYVCEIQQEKDGLHAYVSSEPDGRINITVDARPWFENGSEFETPNGDAFALYIDAVAEDGDTQNDWLTHLPLDRQMEAKAIGDLAVSVFGSGNNNSTYLALYVSESVATGDTQNHWLYYLPANGWQVARVLGEFSVSLDWAG
jgi:hypothetical protein